MNSKFTTVNSQSRFPEKQYGKHPSPSDSFQNKLGWNIFNIQEID